MFVLSVIMFILVPDFVYRMQSGLFPVSRETFNVIIYSFLGLFKIVFLIFNVVPYVALLIVAKKERPTKPGT